MLAYSRPSADNVTCVSVGRRLCLMVSHSESQTDRLQDRSTLHNLTNEETSGTDQTLTAVHSLHFATRLSYVWLSVHPKQLALKSVSLKLLTDLCLHVFISGYIKTAQN